MVCAAEPQGVSEAPAVGGWTLVWADEFDGKQIDPMKWELEVNGFGGWNNELQYYTDRPENAHVSDGRLWITAVKEEFTGAEGKKRHYTSARMITKGKEDWKYGRFEARIKFPRGRGMWPAFWMLPSEDVYGGNPRSGEIDIVEVIGSEASTIYGTLHFGDVKPGNLSSGGKTVLKEGDIGDDFHVYAVEWEEGAIRWYLDGALFHHVEKWSTPAGKYPAPFDRKFHLILNLAVGGNWPGPPDAETKFPQSMEVDYVRVYQRVAEAKGK